MSTLTLSEKNPASITGDVLVVLSAQLDSGPAPVGVEELPEEAREYIAATLQALGASGAADECLKITGVPGITAPLVLTSGTGLKAAPTSADHEAVRAAFGAATRSLTATTTAVLVAGSEPDLVAAAAEGALFGAYAFTAYRTSRTVKTPLEQVVLATPAARTAPVKAAATRAQVLAEAQAFARDLVNTPANELFPQSFADRVTKRLAGTKVKVAVMDEKALVKADCGGLIGVGRGSARPPRLVTLRYAPSKARAHLAVVGKGITFDSGGLCIKPAASMITMKCDMAGAAAAAAAIEAVARLELPVAMTVYLCLAENMTGADAQRPGDVVFMPNGTSVEIINTDAEGRLVLADGLVLASRTEPDVIIDIATLTGAAVQALGHRTSALMSNDDSVAQRMLTAAERVGERQWRMPLVEDLRASMDSEVADIKHVGQREGGMMVAALFLREFVGTTSGDEQVPWAHLDIAGPAFNDSGAYGYTPKGATGHGVRALVGFAEDYA